MADPGLHQLSRSRQPMFQPGVLLMCFDDRLLPTVTVVLCSAVQMALCKSVVPPEQGPTCHLAFKHLQLRS